MGRSDTDTRVIDPGVAALLGEFAAETGAPGGWQLVGAAAGEVIALAFARAGETWAVWLRPDHAKSQAYASTARFKVGYQGELPEGGLALLDALCARLRVAETGLSQAGLARLFETPGQLGELVLGWNAMALRVTLRCNEACPFCSAASAGDNLVTDRDLMHAAIDRAVELGAEVVVLTGGEPTLLPWLPELVQHIRQVGLRCRIETNGVISGAAGYWARYDPPPDEIFLSLHSQNPARLAEMTGLNGTLARKLNCAREARAAGIDVILNTVVTSHNLDEIAELPGWVARTLGTDLTLTLSVAAPLQRAAHNFELVPRARDVAPQLARALSAAEALGMRAVVPEVCGLPRCVLPDNASSFAVHGRGPEHQAQDQRDLASPDRAKSPACRRCRHDATCIGVWRNYSDVFGFDEFQPIPAHGD